MLAEVTGQPVTPRVRLVPQGSGGVAMAEKELTLGPFQRVQVNRSIREMVGGSDETRFLNVEVTEEGVSGYGRALALVTKTDNDPRSKRSDIFVLGPTGTLAGGIGVGR